VDGRLLEYLDGPALALSAVLAPLGRGLTLTSPRDTPRASVDTPGREDSVREPADVESQVGGEGGEDGQSAARSSKGSGAPAQKVMAHAVARYQQVHEALQKKPVSTQKSIRPGRLLVARRALSGGRVTNIVVFPPLILPMERRCACPGASPARLQPSRF
jgi:hypothetical protein